MMEIDTAIERLRGRGLYANRGVPGAMTDREPTAGLTIARALVDVGELQELIDACWVYPLDNGWVYHNWNGIGGRGPDDVHIEKLTLDAAVRYAENFYFGDPLIVEGWSFPVNKHPEWNPDRIIASFRRATRLPEARWRSLRAARYTESRGLDDTSRYLVSFREIESVQPRTDQRLWMRNDLDEMFFAWKQ